MSDYMKMMGIFIIAVFVLGSFATAQPTARLQVIHNAADPLATSVDVYLGDMLLLDDFAFRAATPFVDVPAGVELAIGIAPGNSTSSADVLTTFNPTLMAGETYLAVANGVLDPIMFADNPDMQSIGFTLFTKDGMRETGSDNNNVDFVVVHGSTDAPTVDVIARDVATIVDDAPYGAITDYISVPAGMYTLDVTPGANNNTIVASYMADLSGLGGESAVVFASGFLNPANNQNGQAFGIFAALADGTVVEFPLYEEKTARLQVIHNSADPLAASVDVYLGDMLLLDDFTFRAATPFVDVPAGVELAIGIAPGNSTSSADVIATFNPTLAAGETYLAVANGVLDPMMFADNPDMQSIGFTLFTKDGMRETGTDNDNVDFIVFHGSTDAPTVDVIARDVATIVEDAPYGAITDYISVPAGMYTLDVTPGTDNNTIVASFMADLSGLGGGSAVVFASGFLNSANNQNGPVFGIFAALADGTVVEFPLYEEKTARLQVIHNAADPAAASVDVYLGDMLLLDNFAFRAATPFVDVPAGVELAIGIAPGNSTSSADVLATFNPTLMAGETYLAVANGVLDPIMFAENPDMESIGFTLFTKDGVREAGTDDDNVDFIVVHGSTDAPAVDVIARGVATIVDDAPYGAITDYITVPAGLYTLDVTPGSDNNTIVASYIADLSGLGGGSAVVFASGFLNSANNQNGPSFGLYAALADGNVLQLPANTTSVETPDQAASSFNLGLYPLPATSQANLLYSLDRPGEVSIAVYNAIGQRVLTQMTNHQAVGSHNTTLNTAALRAGVYNVVVNTSEATATKQLVIVE